MSRIHEFKLKTVNEDFEVREVSLEPNCVGREESVYTYFWLKKRGVTTFDALSDLSNFFYVKKGDVSHQGLKDEDGVTFQLVSVKKKLSAKDIFKFNKCYTGSKYLIKIEYISGYGLEPVKAKDLHGNTFKICIRNLKKQTARDFFNFCAVNRFISFINYYDTQRFGMTGYKANTHLIGEAITRNKWLEALKLAALSGNREAQNADFKKIKSDITARDFFLKEFSYSKIKFFISALNSAIWNNAVSAYLKKFKFVKRFYFPILGYIFLPIKTVFQISNIFSAKGYEISEDLEVIKRVFSRNLLVTTSVFASNFAPDELNKKNYKVEISFFLPTGCYATMLIRQIFTRI